MVDLGLLSAALTAEPAPKSCRVAAAPALSEASCDGRAPVLDELVRALRAEAAPPGAEHEEGRRCPTEWSGELVARRWRRAFYARPAVEKQRFDAVLARLERFERCGGVPVGLVRVLRAHLYPECADAIALPLLGSAEVPGPLRVALAGLAFRAHVERTPATRPAYRGGTSAAELERYVEKALLPSVRAQRKRLETAGSWVESLPAGSYGRGVANVALVLRWVELHDAASTPDLGEREATARLRERWAPRYVELRDAWWPLVGSSGETIAAVADTDLVVPWVRNMRWGLADAAHDVVLPPLYTSAEHPGEALVLALLPSYVAARLVPRERLDLATLRALAIAGWDPLLRRALGPRLEGTPDAALVELVADERVRVALRTFDGAQAREAARLLRRAAGGGRVGASPRQRALTALAEAMSGLPTGVEGWMSSKGVDVTGVLNAARSEPFPLFSDLLSMDAGLLAGGEFAKYRAGYLGPRDQTKVDRGLTQCWYQFLTDRPCYCASHSSR